MTKNRPKIVEQIRLNHRIRQFYRFFNENNWDACFQRLDPRLRGERISQDLYAQTMAAFFEKHGPVRITAIDLQMFLDEKRTGNDRRPFAYGKLAWLDNQDQQHCLRERWVKVGTTWYTRMLGLV